MVEFVLHLTLATALLDILDLIVLEMLMNALLEHLATLLQPALTLLVDSHAVTALLVILETELDPMDALLFAPQPALMAEDALNQIFASAQMDTAEILANSMEVEQLLFYSALL